MDKTKWIIFTVVVLGLLGGIIWFSKSSQTSTATFAGDAGKVIKDGPIADRVFGSQDQKTILIEYGDYQCSACGSVFSQVKDLTEKYQDKLTFIFRNFPLTSVHPNALAASTAAEAAGQQGKYWQMHDLLYQSQDVWANMDSGQRTSVFEGYAQQLGLDINKYRQDLSSKDIADKIARDRSSAQTYSVDSTPTFVINGKKFTASGATDIPALTKSIEDALKLAYPSFQPAPAAS